MEARLGAAHGPHFRQLTSLAENARPPSLPDLPAPKPPALDLSIDQGEELFLAEGAEEAEKFLSLLKNLLTATTPDVITLVTIRSDSYERLQMAKPLEGIKQDTMSLPPVQQGSYADIIEGPVRRLKDTPRALKIEPALTQALLTDIATGGAKDALPLLAFTLERLYEDYGGDGNLRFSEYEQLGRIKGSIEAAVESALRAGAGSRPPQDRAAQLALLRRAFIPWLAGIDPETGNPRRRVARLSEIPEEARSLINLLVEQRLLATDVAKGTGEVTIEPAHEALLRQWGLLQTWLVEDSAALTALESVKRAARDWEANGKDASWLTHGGGRLEDAERLRLRPDLAGLLGTADWAYLAACRAREAEENEREEQRRKRELRRNRIIAYGSLAALVIVSVLGWFFLQQKREAVAQRIRAEGTVIAAAQGADQFIIDVADKLRETAGLPLAFVAEFLKNAAKMLDQLHQYNADSPELARSRARFLREMSQTLLAAGDTDSALASAEQSRDMVEKLLAENTRDSKLRLELSLSYNRVGDALKSADRHNDALVFFRRALAVSSQ